MWRLSLVTVAGCQVVFPKEEPTCQPADPIGFWRLDEATGPVAKDSSPNGFDGVYNGALTFAVEGSFPNQTGISVGSDLGFVDLGDHFGFEGTQPFSVEVWIRPRMLATGMFRHIITKQRRSAPKSGWALLLDPSGNAFIERYVDDQTFGETKRAPVSGSAYTYLVGAYDGERLSLYVNALPFSDVAVTGALPTVPEPAIIGGASATRADSSFDGSIDELAIYDYALSPDQVRDHFLAELPLCP